MSIGWSTTSPASPRRRSSGSDVIAALRVGVVALVVVLHVAISPTRAQGVLPDLSPTAREAVVTGRDSLGSYADEAFDALLEHTRSWGRLMHRWAASDALAPTPATPEEIAALLESPEESAGRPVVIFGELLEREPLPKYANVERWLLAPLDLERPAVRPERAVILFVDRTTSAGFSRPEPGWFIFFAGRFYKPQVLPSRVSGEEVAYASLVGATFGARQKRADPASGLFAYIGLGIALMIAAFVTLLVIVSRLRSKPSAFAGAPGRSGAEPGFEDSGLPTDPADALKHLANRADSADHHSNG